MNAYKVTTYARSDQPTWWNVEAEYWEYDGIFVAFYVDPPDGSKLTREIVFAASLALNPVIVKVAKD